jgi:hypothetical protein
VGGRGNELSASKGFLLRVWGDAAEQDRGGGRGAFWGEPATLPYFETRFHPVDAIVSGATPSRVRRHSVLPSHRLLLELTQPMRPVSAPAVGPRCVPGKARRFAR